MARRAKYFTPFIVATYVAALLLLLSVPAHARTNNPPSKEVSAAIHFAAQEWGVSERQMLKVANCESSYNPNAKNGSMLGLFQHATGDPNNPNPKKRWGWKQRVKNFNEMVAQHNSHEPNKLDTMSGTWNAAIDNARITAWMVRNGGWGPWSQCHP